MINIKIAKLKNKIKKLQVLIEIEELKDKIRGEEVNFTLWQSEDFQKPYLNRINDYRKSIELLKNKLYI